MRTYAASTSAKALDDMELYFVSTVTLLLRVGIDIGADGAECAIF